MIIIQRIHQCLGHMLLANEFGASISCREMEILSLLY